MAILALALAACDGGNGDRNAAPIAADPMDPAQVEIGPVIAGVNYSKGLPLHPEPHPDGWAIDLTEGEPHYVTFRHGSLAGKSLIRLRYRVEAADGVEFHPACCPGQAATLALYFQGGGWDSETGRWWSSFAWHALAPGERELVAPLDGNWTAVRSSSAVNNPAEFAAARIGATRVGFTFGGGTGWGHGVRATGQARFVVLGLGVE